MVDLALRTALADLVTVARKVLANLGEGRSQWNELPHWLPAHRMLDASITRAKQALADSKKYQDAWAVLFDAFEESGGVLTKTHLELMVAVGLRKPERPEDWSETELMERQTVLTNECARRGISIHNAPRRPDVTAGAGTWRCVRAASSLGTNLGRFVFENGRGGHIEIEAESVEEATVDLRDRLRYLSPVVEGSPPEEQIQYPEDIPRLRELYPMLLTSRYTDHQVETLWASFSDEVYAAGWLNVDLRRDSFITWLERRVASSEPIF